jgi:hypothetical protein
VRVYKQYTQTCGPYSSQLSNVSVEVYDNPTCDGEPVQEGMAETWSALFLTKVQNTEQWSVLAKKEGYKGDCRKIGIMIPFKENYGYAYLVEDVDNTAIIPRASLNFTFEVSNELFADVFIQGNPYYCTNNTNGYSKRSSTKNRNLNPKEKIRKQKKISKNQKRKQKNKNKAQSDYDFFMKNPAGPQMNRNHGGSGSGSGIGGGGSNSKCYPTCLYNSWTTDASLLPCNCRGAIGGGNQYGCS